MQPATRSGLTGPAMDYLRAGGRELAYPEGAAIVRRGDPGRAFYVITQGEVEVRLAGEGGRPLPLARLSAGASFGEMSLLTDEPVSADVVALGPVKVLAYPAERFQTALGECAPLREQILVRLVNNLHGTNTEAWGFFQRAEVLRTLMQTRAPTGPIIAHSVAMKNITKKLTELAGVPDPILITGEPGTGKLFVAAKIHEAADGGDAPLIVVDCARLAENEAGRILFGSSALREAPNRASTVVPHLFGAFDLAERGTLVLQNVDALDFASQEILSRYPLAPSGDGPKVGIGARLIATTREDLASLVAADRFVGVLKEQLSANVLEVPPLAKRKRDILPLARQFLDERHQPAGETKPRLTTSAEHTLVTLQYRHRNVAELREAVELAAVVADGPEIRAEHIFTGPKGEDAPNVYDLGQLRVVHWLVQGGGLGWLRAGTLVFFSVLILSLMTAGSSVARTANVVTWGLWWPAIIILFLFAGRVWCTVCPLSMAGRLVRRLGGLGRPPSGWIKEYTGWLSALLFLAIIWSEHVFHMTEHPLATGILLLSLAAAATAFCIVYQREVWCRYLCPLGTLSAGYQVPGTLQVRANPGVCATHCTTHECVKGSQTVDGCSVFHHPLYGRDAHFCKLCLACLRSCSHSSPKLYLRLLLQGIWHAGDLSTALVPFALLVFFLSIAMLASHGATWVSTSAGFTVAALFAAGLAVALSFPLPRLLTRERDPTTASRIAFTLLVLAWGPLMAFHLQNVPGLAPLRIHAMAGSFWDRAFPSAEVGLLVVLQLAAICLATVLAGISLWRVRVHLSHQDIRPIARRWRLMVATCTAYVLVAITLTLMQGTHP